MFTSRLPQGMLDTLVSASPAFAIFTLRSPYGSSWAGVSSGDWSTSYRSIGTSEQHNFLPRAITAGDL